MKIQLTLLAVGLCGISVANAQTTTNTYSSTSSTTNPTYTSPVTTDSTNATGSTYSSSPSSSSGSTMSNGTMNSTGTTTNGTTTNGTYSTNSAASPTTTTTTDTYSTTDTKRTKEAKDYKNFVFGIYAGLNTTKFAGESADATNANGDLSGRLGYQAGFFVRGGGRLYGQLGAEYFASSSNYFVAGSGQSANNIQDQINIKYIQVPVYIGYKLVESDRGISAVRLQVGVEYANQIGSNANQFGDLNNFQLKSGTFNGLGQLGFDAGPVFLDLTYHYGFSNAIQQNAGFSGSQRRILSASVGFKF
ncbi:PorT family protein [Spirosoma soli]|uniref:PorT family protein n=1 Tax=Spirosoma soli TaxID=1770529 RepID=A0ABW5M9U7_9BACT